MPVRPVPAAEPAPAPAPLPVVLEMRKGATIREFLEASSWIMRRAGYPPGAWLMETFVLRCGQEFEGRALPDRYPRMPARRCFANALDLSRRFRSLRYVEGFAFPVALTGPAIHHGWCIDRMDRVVDPTWDEPGHSYMGVVYSPADVKAAVAAMASAEHMAATLVHDSGWVNVVWMLARCPELKADLESYLPTKGE